MRLPGGDAASETSGTIGERLALAGVLAIAALLRFLWIADGWFGVDQARDLAWAHAIATGESFPLVGPLMRGRVHLGATYYYFWSLPALLSAAPVASYGFAAGLGVAAVWMTYRLGRVIGGPQVGLVAAMILATTPIAVIDARVSWAPAALPVVVAAFLLAGAAFLRRPTVGRATLVFVLATFGTQLHLAAAPLVPIATMLLLVRWRRLGVRGALVVGAAALVPLLPMAFAYHLDRGPAGTMRGDVRHVPAVAEGPLPGSDAKPTVTARDLRSGRFGDILTASGRVLDAVNPPREERPRLANAWIRLERAWMPLALLATLMATGLAFRTSRFARGPLALVMATVVVCMLVVAVMPAEAWHYYLDTTLGPVAVAIAVVVARRHHRLPVALALGVAAVRTLGLVWWIATSHQHGFVRANLEPLRLGGGSAEASVGRARLLTLRTKEHAAAVLLHDLGIPFTELWQRAHGAAFTDLDGDNGFFFRRAAARAASAAPSTEALVAYAHEIPDAWVGGFDPPRRVGPLAIYRYTPNLNTAEARIESCDDAALPVRPLPDPREYFFGEPRFPAWPCRDAIVRADVAAPPDAGPRRIFARALGSARVTAITSDPPGIAVTDAPPGAGMGVLLTSARAVVRVTLVVDGPAALDLYELHAETGG